MLSRSTTAHLDMRTSMVDRRKPQAQPSNLIHQPRALQASVGNFGNRQRSRFPEREQGNQKTLGQFRKSYLTKPNFSTVRGVLRRNNIAIAKQTKRFAIPHSAAATGQTPTECWDLLSSPTVSVARNTATECSSLPWACGTSYGHRQNHSRSRSQPYSR